MPDNNNNDERHSSGSSGRYDGIMRSSTDRRLAVHQHEQPNIDASNATMEGCNNLTCNELLCVAVVRLMNMSNIRGRTINVVTCHYSVRSRVQTEWDRAVMPLLTSLDPLVMVKCLRLLQCSTSVFTCNSWSSCIAECTKLTMYSQQDICSKPPANKSSSNEGSTWTDVCDCPFGIPTPRGILSRMHLSPIYEREFTTVISLEELMTLDALANVHNMKLTTQEMRAALTSAVHTLVRTLFYKVPVLKVCILTSLGLPNLLQLIHPTTLYTNDEHLDNGYGEFQVPMELPGACTFVDALPVDHENGQNTAMTDTPLGPAHDADAHKNTEQADTVPVSGTPRSGHAGGPTPHKRLGVKNSLHITSLTNTLKQHEIKVDSFRVNLRRKQQPCVHAFINVFTKISDE
jgi:hypothetical protein